MKLRRITESEYDELEDADEFVDNDYGCVCGRIGLDGDSQGMAQCGQCGRWICPQCGAIYTACDTYTTSMCNECGGQHKFVRDLIQSDLYESEHNELQSFHESEYDDLEDKDVFFPSRTIVPLPPIPTPPYTFKHPTCHWCGESDPLETMQQCQYCKQLGHKKHFAGAYCQECLDWWNENIYANQNPNWRNEEDQLNESEYDNLEDADEFGTDLEAIHAAAHNLLPKRIQYWGKVDNLIDAYLRNGTRSPEDIADIVIDTYLEYGYELADTPSGYPDETPLTESVYDDLEDADEFSTFDPFSIDGVYEITVESEPSYNLRVNFEFSGSEPTDVADENNFPINNDYFFAHITGKFAHRKARGRTTEFDPNITPLDKKGRLVIYSGGPDHDWSGYDWRGPEITPEELQAILDILEPVY